MCSTFSFEKDLKLQNGKYVIFEEPFQNSCLSSQVHSVMIFMLRPKCISYHALYHTKCAANTSLQ